jgi:hypothetical protein
VSIPRFPFQEGSSLNTAGINYKTFKESSALKRLVAEPNEPPLVASITSTWPSSAAKATSVLPSPL